MGDSLTPIVELLNEPVQQSGENKRVNSLTEFMDCGEMGYFIEIDPLSERFHDLGKFNDIPVIFSKVLFQEKKSE
jgi:hypothetical protein